ncbi:MAG: hypothetical protein HKN50_11920 [Gammaproteobacteria bacterium]|nr:hypothetical protein [Gammaproteobacteria bacterium]
MLADLGAPELRAELELLLEHLQTSTETVSLPAGPWSAVLDPVLPAILILAVTSLEQHHLQDIAAATGGGSKCGSCRPELSALLRL